MSKQPLDRDDMQAKAITDLALGKLSPFAAWRLRRQIARHPELARQFAETEALFADLRTLAAESPERVAPRWPIDASTQKPLLIFPLLGGVPMNRRTVFAATAAITLLFVTGGYAAVRYFTYDPFQYMSAGNRLVWKADSRFRGEVKVYSPDGTPQGSFGTDGETGAPVAATISLSGEEFPLTGAGRHEIHDPKSGKLLILVDLVPETAEERAAQWQTLYKRDGIEEPLTMSHGASDGYGQSIGFFGDAPKRLTWKLRGTDVTINFYNARTGKRVYSSKTSPVNDAIRAEQHQRMSPEEYSTLVADRTPGVPVFTHQIGPEDGKQMWREMTHTGFGSFPLTLPDGMELRAEIVPNTNSATDSQTTPSASNSQPATLASLADLPAFRSGNAYFACVVKGDWQAAEQYCTEKATADRVRSVLEPLTMRDGRINRYGSETDGIPPASVRTISQLFTVTFGTQKHDIILNFTRGDDDIWKISSVK